MGLWWELPLQDAEVSPGLARKYFTELLTNAEGPICPIMEHVVFIHRGSADSACQSLLRLQVNVIELEPYRHGSTYNAQTYW